MSHPETIVQLVKNIRPGHIYLLGQIVNRQVGKIRPGIVDEFSDETTNTRWGWKVEKENENPPTHDLTKIRKTHSNQIKADPSADYNNNPRIIIGDPWTSKFIE